LTARRADADEITSAKIVQRQLMPDSQPKITTADFAGASISSRALGGDYYDFISLGNDRVALLLADVSGKGTAAALLMANLQGCIRSHIQTANASITAMLEDVNTLFHASTLPAYYATLFFAVYDGPARRLRYANCGHPSAFVIRASGGVERLDATATVLGMFPTWNCEQASVDVQPGDKVFAYSDGVIESGMNDGPEFGEERVISLLESSRHLDAELTVRRVVEAARGYNAGPQPDDLTAICLRVL
jgi:serine phosphatase RsbU (regulator of sigma subunit)